MSWAFSRRLLLVNAGRAVAVGVATSALGFTQNPAASATTFSRSEGEPDPLAPGATFYVSDAGDDSADGRSPESAWATIQKVNVSLPSERSRVLFRRGNTFYGELTLPFGCEVGAYGEGVRPVLTMYKLLNRSDGWTEDAPGRWKIDLGDPTTHGGYTATNDANIGFLVVDDVVKPALKFDVSEMSDPWDFFCDVPNNHLYVCAPANPATLATDIKAAPNGNAHGASGAVIFCQKGANDIHDVHVTGGGGCGIRGKADDVRIRDSVIDYIGGSWLAGHGDGKSRYGNGIELWASARRWDIQSNEIAEIYDVACSAQGRNADGGEVLWEDLDIRNNHIHDCSQSFEFWSESSNSDSPGFSRVNIEGNTCERAGYSVFADVRPDQNVRVHLLTYVLQTPVDITIQDNVFVDSHGAYSYHAYEPPPGYLTRNNIIRLKPGCKMEFQRSETVEEAPSWQAATGREEGSDISILA